jgi:hypothetical protein
VLVEEQPFGDGIFSIVYVFGMPTRLLLKDPDRLGLKLVKNRGLGTHIYVASCKWCWAWQCRSLILEIELLDDLRFPCIPSTCSNGFSSSHKSVEIQVLVAHVWYVQDSGGTTRTSAQESSQRDHHIPDPDAVRSIKMSSFG